MTEQFYLINKSTTTQGQSGPGSNSNKDVINIAQNLKTVASPAILLHTLANVAQAVISRFNSEFSFS